MSLSVLAIVISVASAIMSGLNIYLMRRWS